MKNCNGFEGSIGNIIKPHLRRFLDMHKNSQDPSYLYSNIISEVERVLLSEVMSYSGNVRSKATRILGINRNTLNKKIEKFGISDNS